MVGDMILHTEVCGFSTTPVTGLLYSIILSPLIFIRTKSWTNKLIKEGLMCSPIMWNAGLDESQTGIKITRRNISNLRYTDDATLMAESEEELKSLLMKVKEENEKACLKLNIKNTNIMAPDLIREKWTQWQILFSWAPKSLWVVTAAMKLKDICSMESYDKPRQHIKKQRHHFANKGAYSQSYGFSSSHIQVRVGP